MKKILRLMGVQVRQRFNPSLFRYQWKKERKRFFTSSLVLLVAVLSIGVLYGFYVFAVSWLMQFIRPLHATLASDILALLLFIAAVFVLFSGMRSVLSRIFMAKDTTFLAMLPVRPGTVFLSKFLLVYVGQLATTVLLVLPAALAYQWGAITPGYILRLLLVMLALPGIPLAISALLSLFFMRFSVLSRHRDALAVAGGLLFTLVIIMLQQVVIAQIPEEVDAGFLLQYLLGRGSLITGLTRWFPPARWAAQALGSGGAWLSLLWLLLASGAALVVLYLLAQRMYYRGALTFAQGSARKRTKGTKKPLSYRQSKPWVAVMQREWRVMLRTPIYAMNSLAGIVVLPLIAFISMMQQDLQAEMNQLLTMLHTQINPIYIMLVLTAILCFVASINPAACTVLSREGRCFWLSKILPVPARDQVTGKLVFGLQLTSMFTVISAACVAIFMRGVSAALCVAFVLSLLLGWASVVISVWVDIRSPRLLWQNPTEAIKQNLHAMLSLGIVLALMLVLGLLCWGMIWLGAGFWILSAVLVVLLLALGWWMTAFLLRTSEKAYTRLEA